MCVCPSPPDPQRINTHTKFHDSYKKFTVYVCVYVYVCVCVCMCVCVCVMSSLGASPPVMTSHTQIHTHTQNSMIAIKKSLIHAQVHTHAHVITGGCAPSDDVTRVRGGVYVCMFVFHPCPKGGLGAEPPVNLWGSEGGLGAEPPVMAKCADTHTHTHSEFFL